ncbi:MAG: 50S ribosomal protein L25 [Candidatus Promineifilaceae bacterium]|nr:50S ribosomal protein L25 [Candidatus Promineifilaceae bacterium]
MAERASLTADKRNIAGKKAKQLRRRGYIPAVIYGQGDSLLIQVENLPLRRVLRDAGTTNLIDIQVDNGTRTVLAKDVQTHPTRGSLIHVDFYEVNMQEKIVVEAALVPTGIAPPVVDGLGTTPLVVHAVEIECLPDNLISEIEVDLTQIETPEDMISVGDLPVPEGVDILTDLSLTVARFEYLREEEEEEEEEDLLFAPSAEDVEVIGKGKAEEEEEEFEEEI